MGWKNWSGWLKGGVIGAGIVLVLGVLQVLYPMYSIPGVAIIVYYLEISPLPYFFIIEGFVLGALIGWIIGKVRRK